MKIMIIGSHTPSLWNFRGDFIREIIAKGHEVIACGPEPDDNGRVAELGARFLQIPFERTSTNLLHEIHLNWLFSRIIRSQAPDMVISYMIKPNVYAVPAAKRAKVSQIYAMVTGLGNMFIPKKGLRNHITSYIGKTLYKRAMGKCTRVIFQNPDDIKEFEEYGFIKKGQAALVNGSGVNMERFVPTPMPDEPVFLMVARITREKGIIEYLEASRRLKAINPNVRCLLLGQFEPHAGALKMADIEPYIKEGVIEYLGVADDVRPYISMASILVLPSHREGTPRALLEAMACGRAVVTTDAPGCREVLRHGETGLMVPVQDIDALVRAMNELYSNYELTCKMGAAGLLYCYEKYDVHKVNHDMIRIMGI